MIIAAITDLHGHIEAVKKAGEKLKDADLVLVTGDITHFGKRNEAKEMVEALKRYCEAIYAVPGNCDYPEVGAYLAEEGISLDLRFVETEQVVLAGLGGSLRCPGRTPNEHTEDEFATMLAGLKDNLPAGKPLIFVTHQPPRDTSCDLAHGGIHVGSSSVRRFVEDVEPVLCLSGHIHEAAAVGSIGKTAVVNPGPLIYGGYTGIVIEKKDVKARIRRAF